jgi:acetate kinase
LGLAVVDAANKKNANTISSAQSRIAALVIPTDEQQVIAEEMLAVLKAQSAANA